MGFKNLFNDLDGQRDALLSRRADVNSRLDAGNFGFAPGAPPCPLLSPYLAFDCYVDLKIRLTALDAICARLSDVGGAAYKHAVEAREAARKHAHDAESEYVRLMSGG